MSSPPPPPTEDNVARVRRGIEEVWNNGDWSVASEHYHPDLRVSAPPERESLGLKEFRELHARLRAAFPDLRLSVDRQFGEGDRVVVCWTARGTHEGPFLGVPPSGRRFEVMEAAIFRVEGGCVREVWLARNLMGQMQQLGLMPSGPPPRALLFLIRAAQRVSAFVRPRRTD